MRSLVVAGGMWRSADETNVPHVMARKALDLVGILPSRSKIYLDLFLYCFGCGEARRWS